MYRDIFLLSSSAIIKSRRTIKLLATFILVCCISWILACGESTEPESVTLAGRWEGFVGLGAPPYPIKGDLVLLVDENRECSVDGSMSGSLLTWGNFELRFTGTLHVSVGNAALGEIALTRYRTGIDTVQVTGTMSGQFDLEKKYVLGSWHSDPDEVFAINGEWGAMKKEDTPFHQY